MRRLYEINTEIDEVWNHIEIMSDLTGKIPEELDAMLEALTLEKDEKLENFCKWRRMLELEAEGFRAEEKRIAGRRKTNEKIIERLEAIIAFEVGEQNKKNLGVFKISWRKSVRAIVDNMDLLMAKFLRFKVEPASTEIKKAIQDGELVEGAHLEEFYNMQIK